MKVRIKASRGGVEHNFYVEAADKMAGLAYWRAHSMSKGFSDPVVSIDTSEARAEKRSFNEGVDDLPTVSALADIDGQPLASSRCQTCGMTTLFNKHDKSLSRVHKVGCRAAQKGDFVTCMAMAGN